MKGVERVREFIRRYAVNAEVLEFSDTVESVFTASRASGYPPGKILKTLVVIAEKRPYITILPGDKKLDFKKLSRELNVKNIRLARPIEVENILNVKPGEVSPFLDEILKYDVIVDKSVVNRGEVLVGGGSINHLVKVHVDEIIRVLKPVIKDISK
mgnify:CR=1 FL=1